MRILAQKVKTFFATWEQLCQQYAHSCHLHPCSFFASSICFWNHDEPPFSQYILRFFEFPVITSSFSTLLHRVHPSQVSHVNRGNYSLYFFYFILNTHHNVWNENDLKIWKLRKIHSLQKITRKNPQSIKA